MSRFPRAAHLVRWAQVCLGNHERGGKRYVGRPGHGKRWLRRGRVQAGHAAVQNGQSPRGRVYRRLVARQGGKKARRASGHRMVRAAYDSVRDHVPDRAPAEENSPPQQERTQQRVMRQGAKLGYPGTLTPQAAGAGATSSGQRAGPARSGHPEHAYAPRQPITSPAGPIFKAATEASEI